MNAVNVNGTSFTGGERKIVLYVPDWSVAALASAVPPGAPAVTVSAGAVRECTRTARVFGIRHGMRQLTAQHICEDLIVLAHDTDRDAAEFEVLLQVFDQLVAGVSAIRPGLAWAPIHSSKWQKGEDALMRDLTERIAAETGMEVYVGVGNGPVAAAAAARKGMAIPANQTGEFLADLPLSALVDFLPEKEKLDYRDPLRLLHLLGIRKVEDLWNLGSSQLSTRLGEMGRKLWTLASGGDLFIPTGEQVDPQISIRHPLAIAATGVEHSLLDAQVAAQSLVRKLADSGYLAQALTIRLEFSGGTENERRWALFDVSQGDQVAQRIIWQIRGWQNHVQMEAGLQEEELSLTALHLEAEGLIRTVETGTLWGEKPRSGQVNQTVAQLQSLLGDEAVTRPQLQGGMDPRGRVKMQVWGLGEAKLAGEGEWAGAVQESPLLLFDAPPLAKVLGQQEDDTWGQLSIDRRGLLSGTPSRVAILEGRPELAGGGYDVLGVEGMWAVKGAWWNRETEGDVPRCYLRLRVRENADLLLIQKGSEWRVEGIYVQHTSTNRVPPFKDLP